LSINSPYKGLIPYSVEDAAFFFGREADREIITANLMAARLTLLYGPSGVGKSSLLNAGVVHYLRQLTQQNLVARGAPEQIVAVFNSWRDDPIVGLLECVRNSIAQVFGEKELAPISPARKPAQTLHDWTAQLNTDLFIILDQFEEYFLYHPAGDGDGTFDREFPHTVNRPDLRANFLIAIREDALAKLDRFKGRIPELFDNYLRIRYLDREAARAAIEKPIQQFNRRQAQGDAPITIEPALISEILEQVATGQVVVGAAGRGAVNLAQTSVRIETPYLQLVMIRLWEEEMSLGSSTLRLETLRRLGGAERIVRTHLDAAMSALPAEELDITARLFHHLVTRSGTKIAHTVPDLADYARLEEEQIVPVLEKLSGSGVRILRPVDSSLDQPTVARYEIFHDVLAPAILDWRARHAQARELAEIDRQRATESERHRRELAQSQASAEAQRQRAEIERERGKEHARHAKRLRRMLFALAGVVLAAIAVSIFALVQRQLVKQQARLALMRELVAAAANNLTLDPERSLWLALRAASITYNEDKTVTAETQNVLHQAIQASRARLTIPAHRDTINKVVFSPEGKKLATASTDCTAIVWDATTGEKLFAIKNHQAPVYGVVFSPNGKHLATASDDGTARIWDAATGQEQLRLTGHAAAVYDLAFSPDGKRLATVSGDRTAKIWDAASGRVLMTLSGYDDEPRWVAFSGDNIHLVTSTGKNTAKIWDTRSGRSLTLFGHSDEIYGVAASPDGKLVATSSQDKMVKLWDIASGKMVRTFLGHTHEVFAVTFSPDGKRLATASLDNSAKIWEVASGKESFTLAGHTDEVSDVAFSPDGTRLATASLDHTVKVWDLTSEHELLPIAAHDSVVNSVAFSPEDKRLATASEDKTAKIWDAKSGDIIFTLSGHTSGLLDVVYNHDGTRLATASRDHTAKLWDANSGKELFTLAGHVDKIFRVAFSPDGKRLATASGDSTAKVWDVASGREILTLKGHRHEVFGTAFSPDGQRLATGSRDATAKVWNAATGQELMVLLGHNGRVRGVTFSPDGKLIATAGDDKTAKIWDAETGKENFDLTTHTSGLVDIVFSSDGLLIATAGRDKLAKIWNANSGEELLTLSGFKDAVRHVSFSSDGQRLAAASADKTARVFTLNTEELLKLAWQRTTRGLTPDECRKYLHLEPSQLSQRDFYPFEK